MGKATRVAYGEALAKFGKENKNIVVLDADLAHSTQTIMFAKENPERFFNMGIAEANMICTAVGFQERGYIPFCSTFALFGAGRAFEQIRNSVAYTKANVKLAFSHAGLSVGEDGGSHQSIEDIALMRVLPNMTVLVPCDAKETEKCVKAAIEHKGPVFIRLARLATEDFTIDETEFKIGKANVMYGNACEKNDVCLIACGLMVEKALEAAKMLEAEGKKVCVVNMHTIKPLDKEIILKVNENSKAIVTVEEHSVIGGLGSAVAEVIAGKSGAKFDMVGVMDKFGQSGTPKELFESYGLTAENIAKVSKQLL